MTPLQRLRELCLSLPEVTERRNHGEPAWAVRGRPLVTYSERTVPDSRPGQGKGASLELASEREPAGRAGFWCPAPPGERAALAGSDPERFFRPRFGGDGWVGVYLDVPVDWTEVREIVIEAYRTVAPKRLAVRLE